MHPIVIHDKYVGEDNIEEVKNVTLKDDCNIEILKDGLFIKGKILIKGIIKYLKEETPFNKEIDVDVFLEYKTKENVSYSSLIEDFFYSISQNMILFTLKLNVKEKEILLKENLENIEQTKINKDDISSFIDEVSSFIKENNENVTVFSSLDESRSNEDDVINVEIKDHEKDNEEENKEDEKEYEEEIPLEEIKEVKVSKEKKEPLMDESYSSFYLYYRIKENDTLESICNKFNVTKDDILKNNKKMIIEENSLILIPR